MKGFLCIIVLSAILIGCNTPKSTTNNDDRAMADAAVANDTVRIANEELEYEIIIIEPGFHSWMLGRAKPEGYYSQSYLETRNRIWVVEWNQRVIQPGRFNPNLYLMQIDYDPRIDYGYEVNYKLYYYFVYFQLQYNQRLSGFIPRI
jgi:hypothetical protein